MVQIGLSADGSDLWTLPIEPVVNVDGSNEIITRDVAKGYNQGTVKESWNRADYSITIEGRFIAPRADDGSVQAPSDDVARLAEICSMAKAVKLVCDLTERLGIDQVCITSWSFPRNPGEGIQNQRYVIKCISDYPLELIV